MIISNDSAATRDVSRTLPGFWIRFWPVEKYLSKVNNIYGEFVKLLLTLLLTLNMDLPTEQKITTESYMGQGIQK